MYRTSPTILQILYVIILPSILSIDGVTYNYTSLIKKYFLMCGPQYSCTKSTLNLLYDHLQLCPPCSCVQTCILLENCCPDYFFQLPMQIYEDVIILDSTTHSITDVYPMVKTCPESIAIDVGNSCTKNWTAVDKIRLPPVTSNTMPITYSNIHCARCNGNRDFNVYQWQLNISCYQFLDFNYLSSYQQVLDHASERECTIRHETNHSQIRVFSPDESVYYDKCNMTGLWKQLDSDIMLACESTYTLKYRVFKNIFCYICNPVHDVGKDIISHCNETGMWTPFNNVLEKACKDHEQLKERYPFKNIFCYLCNRNNSDDDIYQDVAATRLEEGLILGRSSTYYTIYVEYFKIPYYKTLIDFPIVSTETNVHNHYINITNVLMQTYARNPFTAGLCNESILPLNIVNILKQTWGDCSCDPSSFFNSDTPCMDISLSYPMDCMSRIYYDPEVQGRPQEYYAVTNGCYKQRTTSYLVERCSGEVNDSYTLFPVFDVTTNVVYKNFDCYLCNKQLNWNHDLNSDFLTGKYMMPMMMLISCENSFVDFTRYLLLYDAIHNAKLRNCRIRFLKIRPLHKCMKDELLVDKCNQTSIWPTYDPDIALSCKNLSEASLPIASNYGYEFKNIYCLMCNPKDFNDDVITTCNKTGACMNYDNNTYQGCDSFPLIFGLPPFKNAYCMSCNTLPCFPYDYYGVDTVEYSDLPICSMEGDACSCLGSGCIISLDIPGVKIRNIFRVNDYRSTLKIIEVSSCLNDQIFDEIEGICYNVTCYPGKFLNGTKCVPLFPVARHLRYILEFNLSGDVLNITDLGDFLEQIYINLSPWLRYTIMDNSDDALNLMLLQSELRSTHECDSEINNTILEIQMYVQFFIESPVYRLCVEDRLLKIGDWPFIVTHNWNQSVHFTVTMNSTRVNDTINNTQCIVSKTDELNIEKYRQYRQTVIRKQIVCRLILYKLNKHVYINAKKELRISRYNLTFTSGNYIIQWPYAQICLEDVHYLMIKPPALKSPTELALEILTIICTCISLVCLVLTFFTYCCFKSLRTLPGKNNMCLIFSLFIAQAFLQFGTIWTDYIILCQTIGLLLHVFWLSTFGCMNVCSFHMFKIFTTLKPIDNTGNDRQLVRYILYSFGAPVGVVMANVAVHFIISKVTNIGYGGQKCFITDSLSQIISFVFPVGLICLINILLFSVTAYKVRSTPNVRSTRNDRNDFIIYVKLFALTGITWLGQIVDSFLPLSILSFIVTVLTGLQGLFIFLSYACNHRVLHMYKSSVTRQTSTPHQKATTKSSLSMNEVPLNSLSS